MHIAALLDLHLGDHHRFRRLIDIVSVVANQFVIGIILARTFFQR
jgi:hypothetical protein